MTLKRTVYDLLETWRRHGLVTVGKLLVDELVNRIISAKIVNIVWLDLANLHLAPRQGSQFTFRFLSADEVREFAADPTNGLREAFVTRAKVGRDLCFGALTEGKLAAYGWYALGSIEAEHASGASMSFPSDVAYMYNGFTHPNYRGARLHASIMGLALQQLSVGGVNKLVSQVHWTNEASMHSCYRAGFVLLGRLWVIRLGSRKVVIAPRRAKRLRVRFATASVGRGEPAEMGEDSIVNPDAVTKLTDKFRHGRAVEVRDQHGARRHVVHAADRGPVSSDTSQKGSRSAG